MSNQWIITKDIIEDGEAEGIKSSSFDKNIEMPVSFQLFDDDEILYLEGKMEKQDFHPLDELGQGYGCTHLKTSINGNLFTVL